MQIFFMFNIIPDSKLQLWCSIRKRRTLFPRVQSLQHPTTKIIANNTLLVCLSLLTMTNPNQLFDVLLFVCSKMADETNLSSKLPVADRTREV